MIKVMIVDDMPKHRAKMLTVINSVTGYEVVASLQDGVDVIHWLHNKIVQPDIVLLDVEMYKMDGITLLEYLSEFFPAIKVIMVSTHHEKKVIEDALVANAHGFVWKYDDYAYLKKALEAVANNEQFIDPRLNTEGININQLSIDRKREKEILHNNYQLTDRELRILKVICAQINYIEIGNILHISQRTVETYVGRLNKKLGIGLGGRLALAQFSLRRGITKIARL